MITTLVYSLMGMEPGLVAFAFLALECVATTASVKWAVWR
jgi:hypothetical protein